MNFMLWRSLVVIIGLCTAPLHAQGAVVSTAPGITASDLANTLSGYAPLNAVPPICPNVPAADTYTGTAGVQTACTPRADNARPTQVQSSTATTASDGTFSGTWTTPFANTPQYAHAEINSTTAPYDCGLTWTATSYSGKCFMLISTTLPSLATSLLGLVISPFTTASAGQSVRVIARQ